MSSPELRSITPAVDRPFCQSTTGNPGEGSNALHLPGAEEKGYLTTYRVKLISRSVHALTEP